MSDIEIKPCNPERRMLCLYRLGFGPDAESLCTSKENVLCGCPIVREAMACRVGVLNDCEEITELKAVRREGNVSIPLIKCQHHVDKIKVPPKKSKLKMPLAPNSIAELPPIADDFHTFDELDNDGPPN